MRKRKIRGLSRHSLSTRRSLVQRLVCEGGFEKISRFKIFRELRLEFPGMGSEQQNNYPKGTIQIESNSTYEYTNPNLN